MNVGDAAELLRRGEVVAMPTETVYGLAADARRDDAVEKIFTLKGRPSTNPLIVHVADVEQAWRYASHVPAVARTMAETFWPGPLTLVLPAAGSISRLVTAGLNTVGLRVPNHPVALELLQTFGGPLAAPSANRSTRVSPTTAAHVAGEFDVPILDGGPCAVGVESTVLDLTTTAPRLLRPGGVTRTELERFLGPIDAGRAVTESHVAATSPGQHAVHYSPTTPAFFFDAASPPTDLTDAAIIGLTADPATYQRHLYARLRLLDSQQLRAIYLELPPDTPAWAAARDRVLRAARPV